MGSIAQLLTGIAAVVGAVAWPLVFLVVILNFRGELRTALGKVPVLLERLKKASLPGIALELDRVADAEAGNEASKDGTITPRQVEAAARIEIQTRETGAHAALLSELDRLCLEYDSLRRTLPSGDTRTRAMTRVLVKMRSLAPSLLDYLDIYKGSGSPGSRLAAIAMMQMEPHTADLDWLKNRFSSEHPFIFYHAALALQNFANIADGAAKRRLRKVTQDALAAVRGFAGAPDQSTIEVLDVLLDSLPRQ